MTALSRALLAGVAAILLATAPARSQAVRHSPGPYHPMDALTIDEVLAAVRLVREAGYADAATRFPMVTLKEMPKADVRAWRRGQPFSRSALVVMRKPRATSEALVDLTGGRVASHREVPGAQPSVMNEEWREAQRLTMADPRWQAAMRARGFEDFSGIFCGPMAAGAFPGDGGAGRRLLKVPCYDNRADGGNPHGQPVEGVLAVVDVDAGGVVEVLDSGAVPLPKARGQMPEPARRSPLKPVINASPAGGNFQIRGNFEVTWQNWSFHVRADRRSGAIVSLVRYADGGRARDIAYQMALSELFVPYMDTDPQWAFRTPLDVGEYGLGYLASPLTPGADCPQQAAFLDLVMPSDTGELFKVERGLCIFERATGDPVWRHAPAGADVADSRPGVELVVRTIPTIGNYDYAVDWVFTLHGNIRIRVGATGFDAVKGVAAGTMGDPTAAADTRYGTLVAANTVAVNHDHFFSFRLDLDVDGPANTLLRERLVPRRLPEGSARRSLWVVEADEVAAEGPVVASGHDAVYRLVNRGARTALGHPPSVQILPGHGALSLLDADDPTQARAAFSAERLWLSRYRPDELHAAGPYPNRSAGGDGLPRYAGDGEAATDADLVVWYTMGFHHVTRVEDWPVMPTLWHEVTLRPFNFFDRNPSSDLPARFERAP